LITLVGTSHPAFEGAKAYLESMKQSPEWGEVANFYIEGESFLEHEISRSYRENPDFSVAFDRLFQWITHRENLSDINHVEIDVNRELDRLLKFGLNVGEKGEGVEAAYDALIAIGSSLGGNSDNGEIAIALAQRDGPGAFADLQRDREVLAAANRLSALGLDETATTQDIAEALADPAHAHERFARRHHHPDSRGLGALALRVGGIFNVAPRVEVTAAGAQHSAVSGPKRTAIVPLGARSRSVRERPACAGGRPVRRSAPREIGRESRPATSAAISSAWLNPRRTRRKSVCGTGTTNLVATRLGPTIRRRLSN